MQDKDEIIAEFDRLKRRYCNAIAATSGCGSRGQSYVDAEKKRLDEFYELHKDILGQLEDELYVFQVPVRDDGSGGLGTGLAGVFQESARRGEDPPCLIQ